MNPPPPPARPVAAPPAATEVQDYRWQLVAVDLVSSGLAAANPEIWLGGYLLGAPAVHVAHGNAGRALGSLGLRVGLPVVAAGIGSTIARDNCSGGSYCGLEGIALGIVVGMGAAVLVDWTLLGKVEKPVERPAFVRAGGVAANPTLAIGRQGSVRLGLAGTF